MNDAVTPRCPACRRSIDLPIKGGRYDFKCVHCCARLIVHARPAKAQQEAHFSAIGRLDAAPAKEQIVGAIQRGELVEGACK
jgi:hypothetical protein